MEKLGVVEKKRFIAVINREKQFPENNVSFAITEVKIERMLLISGKETFIQRTRKKHSAGTVYDSGRMLL